jgi:hypothetical protein
MEMWGWPLSSWEKVFFIATAAAAVFGGLGIMAAFISGVVGYQVTDRVLKDADVRIADANRGAADANAKAESERLARMELEKFVGPRYIAIIAGTPGTGTERLKQFAGTPYILQFVPNDMEINRLAQMIEFLLRESNWVKVAMEPRTDLKDGVTVQTRPFSPRPNPVEAAAKDLGDFLEANGIEIIRLSLSSMSIPEGTVLITIGIKPWPLYSKLPQGNIPEGVKQRRDEYAEMEKERKQRLKKEWQIP